MKFIRKREEPSEYLRWKQQKSEDWQPNWENLRDGKDGSGLKPKSSLKKSLMEEQGYLCCYCGRRIDLSSSHIEHLKPRHSYPKLSLDYSNLLASCPGYSEEEALEHFQHGKLPQEHCGHLKGSWYDEKLMVSPLEERCEISFRYTAFGEILAGSSLECKEASLETIKRLGLNASSLQRARRTVLEEIISFVDELSDEELLNLAQDLDKPDDEGKYVRFYSAIVYVLKALIFPHK